MKRQKALFVLEPHSYELIYGPEERRDIAELVDVIAPLQTRKSVAADPRVLAEADVMFSGWGAPVLDTGFLDAAPALKAFFYGSGSIRGITTDAFWRRDVLITSAYAANAVPVAEYTLSVILLSLKHFWRLAAASRHQQVPRAKDPVPGAYRATVGLVSFGMVARRTRELLRAFDLNVMVYCPFLTEEEAAVLQVERVTLAELFRRADVVSLHTPSLPETRGMVDAACFRAMKPGATFVNTARGAVVREDELIAVLTERPDLTAVLDVTDPEPAAPDSPLRTLPNVVLTPHIAGSMNAECRRMGRYMVEELRRYLVGEPLHWRITEERSRSLA